MAREDIQLNMVAPQNNVVQPADIYSRPYWDRDAGKNYMELAKALGVLGDTIAAKQAKAQAGQDQAHYDNYTALAAEFGDPEAKNAGIITNKGIGLVDLFSTGKSNVTVRNRVEEVQGDTAATTDFYSEKGYGSRLFAVANDPAALQAEIKKIRAEAYAKVKGRPAFGDNYIKQTMSYLDGFSAKAYEQRAKQYQETEKLNVAQSAAKAATPDPTPNVDLHDHVEGASNSLISYLSKGKPTSYITDLQPKMASAMQRMIAAAPPEIRAKIRIDSGARTPQRQYELIKAKLSKEDAASLAQYVAKAGPETGTAMWAKANPAAAQARGIGRMIALPGRSLHQHGYAIDLARDPQAEAWLHKNAGRFGLYYPMHYEPWHIELIGGRANRNVFKGSGMEKSLEPPTFGPFKPDMNVSYRGYDNSPNFFENYYKVVGSAENAAGDPYAQNPLSSATGHSQFIDSTWVEMYGKVYGDTGLTRDEILALRSDKDVDKKITIEYAKENAKVLEGYAIPVNTTTLLMAHQLGGKGAAMVLQAFKDDASQPIENVLPDKVMKANPQYNGQTVAQVYAAAAGKTGEFTDPVGGAKERTTTAYLEGLHSSPLGPVEYTDSFAEAIINQAVATGNTEVLDSMPSEIMGLPKYADKVAAARDKIMTNARQELVFRQGQQDRQEKETTENVLSQMAALIVDDPRAEMPPEVQKAIMALPGGGFEVLKKLDEFRKARLLPTPEQKRNDQFFKAQAAGAMIEYANGTMSFDDVKQIVSQISDPELYGAAYADLLKYEKLPLTLDSPLVKESKRLFMAANYNYIEGTPIKDPLSAKRSQDATKWYNTTLAALLAAEPAGQKVSERRLLEIIDEVETSVANKVQPTVVEGANNTTGNAANSGAAPADPPPPPVQSTIPGMTPEQQALYDKYKPSNKLIGVGPH